MSTARLRRETSQFAVLWRTWTYNDEFSFLFLNLNKILKNSAPGKVACIWHIERVQIEATLVVGVVVLEMSNGSEYKTGFESFAPC